jgi:hypothetical protein
MVARFPSLSIDHGCRTGAGEAGATLIKLIQKIWSVTFHPRYRCMRKQVLMDAHRLPTPPSDFARFKTIAPIQCVRRIH